MATPKKDPKDHLPKGRPSKYTDSMCEIVVSCMRKGYIVDEVCAELGIHRDTFFEWTRDRPDFSDSYKKGKAAFGAFWARAYKNAMLGVPITKEGEKKTERKITRKITKKGGKEKDEQVEVVETGNVEFKANPAMMIFYMKAHCGWKETVVNRVKAKVTLTPETQKKLDETFNDHESREKTGTKA